MGTLERCEALALLMYLRSEGPTRSPRQGNDVEVSAAMGFGGEEQQRAKQGQVRCAVTLTLHPAWHEQLKHGHARMLTVELSMAI